MFNMLYSTRLICSCLVLFSTGFVHAGATYSPKPGSAERKAIMDALRKPVMRVVKHKVIFKVGMLRVQNGWAFMQGNAVKPDGSSLGDRHLWGEMAALLGKQGRTWKVLHWGFATDTSVMDEAKRRYPKAPRAIFAG